MEEIVAVLQKIADSMGQNTVPTWLAIIGIVVPIILTCVSIAQGFTTRKLSIRMEEQNRELQKQLHNRDVINQSRECVLEIYNTYRSALNLALQADKNVADIFTSDQNYYQWGMSVQNMQMNVMSAYNRAKLMVGTDAEMINYLNKCWQAFAGLSTTIDRYVGTGIPSSTIQNAWAQFSAKYAIYIGDYGSLYRNRVMREEFMKLCENTYTQEIQEKITSYINLVGCEDFDKHFEKYTRIEQI